MPIVTIVNRYARTVRIDHHRGHNSYSQCAISRYSCRVDLVLKDSSQGKSIRRLRRHVRHRRRHNQIESNHARAGLKNFTAAAAVDTTPLGTACPFTRLIITRKTAHPWLAG